MKSVVVHFVAALAAAAGFASPGLAAWDFTRWGMTAAELQAESGGRVKPCDYRVPACDVQLVGYRPNFFMTGLTVSGLQADVGFELEQMRGLVRAMLKFGGDGRNARYLQKALGDRYGLPFDVKKSFVPHVRWHDAATGTAVRLIDLSPGYVLIEFTPYTAADQ